MMPTCIDLTGQRFGRLTVLEKDAPSKTGHARWICRCDCGNQKSIASAKLRSGNTKSCGCLRSEMLLNNLTGKRFGKLVAIERDDPIKHKENNQSRAAFWICKCDCGNTTIVSSGCLLSGDTQSCGCLKSKGEELISSILNEHDIEYKQQFTFPKLVGEGNKPLRFDFAVFDQGKLQCLIEFQGEQHYQPHIYDSEDKFQTRLRYDQLKRNFCQQEGIRLIEIPYWDRSKITWEYLNTLINER